MGWWWGAGEGTPKQTSKELEDRETEEEKKGQGSRTEEERKAKRESRLDSEV